ncbi:MAG: aldehyde ferredoxin oxidoreductase family protein, partial [Candidatus Ranarchaeia archaeon]
EVPANIDPLGPKNKIVFGAGVLVGSSAPCACRMTIDTINPFTKGVASSNAGGRFGPVMKYAGYDHIVIEEKADNLVYLWIDDENIEIRDATHLMNMTTGQASAAIKEEHQDDTIEVAVIGPAGERLAYTANVIISDGRASGRGGVGAVMGSKKLKAVAVRGTGEIHVADPLRFENIVHELWERILKNDRLKSYRQSGTTDIVKYGNPKGMLPVHNNLDDHLPEDIINNLTFEHLKEYLLRRLACFGCRIRCSSLLKIPPNPGLGYPEVVGEGIQANTINNFGSRLGFTDIQDSVRAHLLCTDLGLDMDAASNAIAWAIECWERNLITEEDTNGLELKWNDPPTVFKLLKQMARKQGFGSVLADGAVKAATKIGRWTARYVMHTKGQDLYESCRVRRGWSLGVALDQRGGSHLRGTPVIETTNFTSEDAEKIFGVAIPNDPLSWQGKPEIVAFYEDFKAVIDSVNICYFATIWSSITKPRLIGYEDIAALLTTATGKPIGVEELKTIGARIHHIEKAINVRTGMTREQDTLPSRFFSPAPNNPDGPHLDKEGFEKALTRYYELRGWDPLTGIPPEKAYDKLGLYEMTNDPHLKKK